MLYIIGLGLDKRDISLKALDAIKKCKKVYLENYTSYINPDEIEKIIEKKVVLADRKIVEEGKDILENAKKRIVVLLVPGDPLAATTHIDMILRCIKEKIKVKIIHSVSIFNAIAETGLQLYKFGKTASIAKWQQSFRPESFYEIIKENESIGAHTLLLIDIGMAVNEALDYLESVAKTRDTGLMVKEILVCENIGAEKQRIRKGTIEQLINKKFNLPACIIVPGKLHFMEEEALKHLAQKR